MFARACLYGARYEGGTRGAAVMGARALVAHTTRTWPPVDAASAVHMKCVSSFTKRALVPEVNADVLGRLRSLSALIFQQFFNTLRTWIVSQEIFGLRAGCVHLVARVQDNSPIYFRNVVSTNSHDCIF